MHDNLSGRGPKSGTGPNNRLPAVKRQPAESQP
jgi:hypothetical protein